MRKSGIHLWDLRDVLKFIIVFRIQDAVDFVDTSLVIILRALGLTLHL